MCSSLGGMAFAREWTCASLEAGVSALAAQEAPAMAMRVKSELDMDGHSDGLDGELKVFRQVIAGFLST